MPWHGLFQDVNQRLTHRQDALTHRFHFGKPGRFQRFVTENRRHHLSTKVWRAGVDTAHRRFQLAQHAARRFGVFTHHGQATNAFTVQGEDLREGVTHQYRQPGAGSGTDGIGVFFHTRAKALVGNVEERDQVTGLQHLDHRIPLGMGEIRPGWVMAAWVQQHNTARWQRVQLFQQRVNAHAVRFAVEPRIGRHLKARALEDRNVVFPRRVADPHA